MPAHSFAHSNSFRVYFVMGSKEIAENKTHKIFVIREPIFYQTYETIGIELNSAHSVGYSRPITLQFGLLFSENPSCVS